VFLHVYVFLCFKFLNLVFYVFLTLQILSYIVVSFTVQWRLSILNKRLLTYLLLYCGTWQVCLHLNVPSVFWLRLLVRSPHCCTVYCGTWQFCLHLNVSSVFFTLLSLAQYTVVPDWSVFISMYPLFSFIAARSSCLRWQRYRNGHDVLNDHWAAAAVRVPERLRLWHHQVFRRTVQLHFLATTIQDQSAGALLKAASGPRYVYQLYRATCSSAANCAIYYAFRPRKELNFTISIVRKRPTVGLQL